MSDKPVIRRIEDVSLKQQIASEVLLDLPDWFGLPESTADYIKDAQDLPFWAAFIGEGAVGFVTLTHSSADCGDVHCMGVKKAHHRQGIGRLLMDALVKEAAQHYEYLQVKTVDEGHYKEYDQTIAFYRHYGFRKLEVFPTLWDPWNPCLVMVMKL